MAGDDRPAAVFLIGGADGLAPSLRDKATLRLSFGAATWPHQLVRVMLLEQLYRATTILDRAPLSPGVSSFLSPLAGSGERRARVFAQI